MSYHRLLIAVFITFSMSLKSLPVPLAWGNIFTCTNPLSENHLPFGIVFDRAEIFSSGSDHTFLSVGTYFNSGDSEAERKERVHLVPLSITKSDENTFQLRSDDRLYAFSISCTSRCDYAGSSWEGKLTYATTWDVQLVQGVRTDLVSCLRVGWRKK